MKIYAIRHGLTELNKQRIINGRIPDSLSVEGEEQARRAAETLPRSIKHIYSSPLTRAKQTADILNAQIQVPVTYHDGLQEVSFGDLDGTPYRDEYKLRQRSLEYDWRPSGENFDDVKQRVLEFLAELEGQTKDSEALIVAHSGVMRTLVFLEQGTTTGNIENAELYEFDLDRMLAS